MPYVRARIGFEAGTEYDALVAAIVGLGLNYAAYESEIYRAGIQAVPRGQMEAAQVLGMSAPLTLRRVILPQALRVALPGVTNDFIALLKDSSLVFVVGLGVFEKELTSFGRDAMSVTGNPTPLFMAAISYLVLTLPLTYLASLLEKKLDPKR